jgi:hypothetical protein
MDALGRKGITNPEERVVCDLIHDGRRVVQVKPARLEVS